MDKLFCKTCKCYKKVSDFSDSKMCKRCNDYNQKYQTEQSIKKRKNQFEADKREIRKRLEYAKRNPLQFNQLFYKTVGAKNGE